MAFMFPKVLPQDVKQGVKYTRDLLGRLPDDCLVYYEPLIARRYPHFIVIMPTAGVLLVEVCDWRNEEIESVSETEALVAGKPRKLPRVKAEDYLLKLLRRCKKDGHGGQLLHKQENDEETFSIPFAHVAVLPYIESEQLTHLALEAPENTIAGDRLFDLIDQQLSPDQAVALCKSFFRQKCSESLTDNVLSELRALIHPEIAVPLPVYGIGAMQEPSITAGVETPPPESEPKTGPAPSPRSKPAGKSLKVMDLEQEQAAISLRSGHRLLWGVAGSGKTIILIARARFLAHSNPSAKILVTCFNVTLANYLKRAFEGLEKQITVTNFHKLAFDAWKMRFNPNESAVEYSDRLKMYVTAAKSPPKYDMILIDEAQDFDPEWFRSLLTLMKDPVNGDFVIVGDGTQGIYKSRKISWKSLGIQAMGRTTYFKKNYRNSKEIIMLASKFANSVPSASDEEASVESVVLSPECAVRSSGIKPVLVHGLQKEAGEKVVAIIEGLLHGTFNGQTVEKLDDGEIAVLYASSEGVSDCLKAIRSGLRQKKIPVLSVYKKVQKEQICSPDLKVLSIYSAKGLQYKAVFLLGVDSLPRDTEEFPVEADEKLMYVALTRAEDYLVAVAGENSSLFAERLAEAVSEGLMEEYHEEA